MAPGAGAAGVGGAAGACAEGAGGGAAENELAKASARIRADQRCGRGSRMAEISEAQGERRAGRGHHLRPGLSTSRRRLAEGAASGGAIGTAATHLFDGERSSVWELWLLERSIPPAVRAGIVD